MYDEWNKMLCGAPYNATEPYFYERLLKTKELILHYNQLPPSDSKGREKALKDLFGYCGVRPVVNSPFCCDFGCNISVGDYFFANFYLTILDEAKVSIGNHVYIGPNVRNDVWIGGSVTVLPDVTIGHGSTIGAGSVVIQDIPDGSVAVGNPCRVVKTVAYSPADALQNASQE